MWIRSRKTRQLLSDHGVGLDVYEKLAKVGAEVIDATCPFVARIHKIAAENRERDMLFLSQVMRLTRK